MSLENVRERALQDLLEAEQALRAQAEAQVRALRNVLYFLAQRLSGDKVEHIRRSDPAAFRTWTPDQWRRFFADLSLDNNNGWRSNGSKKDDCQGKLAAVQAENQRLLEQIRALEKRVHSLEQELEQERHKPPRPASETTPAQQQPRGDDAEPWSPLGDWLQALRDIRRQPPRIPSRVEQAFSHSPIGRTRQIMVLYLIAVGGVALRVETDALIAQVEQVKARSGSLRRRIDDLVTNGLLVMEKLPLDKRRFVVFRLSEDGRRLAEQMFGRKPVENEWERLIRQHEGERFPEHTAAVLVTAAQARARGYRAEVLPQVDSPSPPDLLIEKPGERLFVEVELGRKEKVAKWRHNAKVNGGIVAVVTATPDRRSVLVADIKRMGLPGKATDFVHLLQTPLAEISPEDEFWAETW